MSMTQKLIPSNAFNQWDTNVRFCIMHAKAECYDGRLENLRLWNSVAWVSSIFLGYWQGCSTWVQFKSAWCFCSWGEGWCWCQNLPPVTFLTAHQKGGEVFNQNDLAYLQKSQDAVSSTVLRTKLSMSLVVMETWLVEVVAGCFIFFYLKLSFFNSYL